MQKILNALIEKKCSALKKVSEIFQEQEKKEKGKELQYFQEVQISDDEYNKLIVSSVATSVETGEISSSSSEWKTGSDRETFIYLS